METLPHLDQFPFQSHDKIRYADTDRLGHVNNAVFSTFLETGRVEILYNGGKPAADPGCTFVIVHLELNFHAEINWPGQVQTGTRVAKIGRSSVAFEQAIFQDGGCKATAKTVVVQMNETTRLAQPLSEAAASYFSARMGE